MITLASEIQAMIAGNLDPLDLYHLQQTCKSFNALIKDNIEVWKTCLKRVCHVHGLIWASFNRLSSASHFKSACTRPWRVKKVYQSGEAGVVNPRRLPPSGEDGKDNEDEDEHAEYGGKNPRPVKDMFPIPGGRYLVTFQDKKLQLWDMAPSTGAQKPSILLEHALDFERGNDMSQWKFDVVNLSTVHILFCDSSSRVPQEAISNLANDPSFDPTDIEKNGYSVLRILEISIPALGGPSIREIGALRVVHRRCRTWIHTTHANGFRIFHYVGTTVVWDYENHQYSAWVTPETLGVTDITSHLGHVIYVNESTIEGAPLPQSFQPIPTVINLESASENAPAFRIFFPQDDSDDEGSESDGGSDQSNWRTLIHHPIFEDGPVIFEQIGKYEARRLYLKIHQTVDGDPSSSSRKATLVFSDALSFPRCLGDDQTHHASFWLPGGDLAIVWDESLEETTADEVRLAIHPATPKDQLAVLFASRDVTTHEDSVGDFPLLMEAPRHMDRIQQLFVCTWSGKLTVLWADDGLLEMYDLFKN